jgi:hypothetical protein
MEARSRWPSIINEKTFADFKRVAEQTGILTKEPDHPPERVRSVVSRFSMIWRCSGCFGTPKKSGIESSCGRNRSACAETRIWSQANMKERRHEASRRTGHFRSWHIAKFCCNTKLGRD